MRNIFVIVEIHNEDIEDAEQVSTLFNDAYVVLG